MNEETNTQGAEGVAAEELLNNDADLADFDSPAATKDAETETVAQGAAEAGTDAEAPVTTEAEKPEAEHKPVMIPKARFDEVNGELRDLKARMEAFEEQQRQAAIPPARDFAAERAALKKSYAEDGEIDQETYLEAREAIAIAEAEARFNATLLHREQENARLQAQQSWQQRITSWQDANADFLANAIRRGAVESLLAQYGKDPSLDNDALLAKVEAEAFEAFNWGAAPAAGGDPSVVVNLHAARNAADARAQAAASSAPSAAGAGSGDRGRKSFPGIQNISDADYKNLPPEVREAKDLANF